MIQRWHRRGKYQLINYGFIWEFRFVRFLFFLLNFLIFYCYSITGFVRFHGHFIKWKKLYRFAKNMVFNKLINETDF